MSAQSYTPDIPVLQESSLVSGTQALKSFADRGKEISTEQIRSLGCILIPLQVGGTELSLHLKQDIELLSIEFYPQGKFKRSRVTGVANTDTLFYSFHNRYFPKESKLEISYPGKVPTRFLCAVYYRRVHVEITPFTDFIVE